MIKQKPITNSKEIAERCLTSYWHGKKNWDIGSPAWYFSIKWSQRNFTELKELPWTQIYKRYRQALVQE